MLWCVTQWLTGRHPHRHDTVPGRHCFETARAVLGAATGRGPRRRDCGILRGGIVTLALSRGCPLSIAVLCSGLSHHGSENIIKYTIRSIVCEASCHPVIKLFGCLVI